VSEMLPIHPAPTNKRILPGAVTETYINKHGPGRPRVTRCHAGPVEVYDADAKA
jgi:hypothetical protein